MNSQQREIEFVKDLTQWQGRLLGYLVSILGNIHDAKDVLQVTNVKLWEKKDDFKPGAEFGPWAKKFAYFQALAFIRDRKRDKHFFDDDLMLQLADEEVVSQDPVIREVALRDCLTKLSEQQRELIKSRYSDGGSIYQAMSQSGKKESATKVALMRIRKALFMCMESKIPLH